MNSNLAWLKKVGSQYPHPPWQIQSPECLVNRKNSEKFLVSNLAWTKKVGAQAPPLKNSESSQIWHDQKKLVPRHHWQIQSPVCTPWSKIVLKTFWPQIWHDQKKLVPGITPILSLTNFKSPECLLNKKNSEKFLVSNLAWPKESWCLHTPHPKKI